jgi:hypothetical protein
MTTQENNTQIETKCKPVKPIPMLPKYIIPQQLNSIYNQNLSFSNNNQQSFQEFNNQLESNTYCHLQNLQNISTNDNQSLKQENIQLKTKLVQEFHNSQQLQIDIKEFEYLHNRLKLLINQLKGRIECLEEQNYFLKAENELLNMNLKKVSLSSYCKKEKKKTN